ncbi:MAG: T9SS type A sorting domain-containing protein [Bacteroidota bacterium]
MKKLIPIIFGILLYSNLHAQLQDRIWIFGRPFSGTTNATLYFGNLSNPVKPLPCGQPSNITTSNGFEEWAVATHPTTGNLVFYTDGRNVFDKFHTLIDIDPITPGYESLGANPSSSQPVAISLVPGAGADGFYIFSNGTGANAISVDTGIITYRLYNVISDVFGPVHNLPGPYGLSYVSEGMKIIPSETEPNVLWLITSLFPIPGMQYKYVVYKINQSVVTYQGVVDMGPIKLTAGGSGASPIINITYTESNTAVGVSRVGFSSQYTSSIFVCDFDNTNGQFLTGTLKSYITGYDYIPSVYDLEFSPNGKFLYYSVYYSTDATNDLYQINLQNPTLSSVLVHQFNNRYAGGLKLAADGLIYHIHDTGFYSDTTQLGRILQPDVEYVPGVTVFNQFYQERFQVYPHIYSFGLPEFLILPTATTGNAENSANIDLTDISIYPNPGTDYISITNTTLMKNGIASVYNIQGQLLFQQKITQDRTEIDIRNLSNGIYVLSMVCNDKIKVLRFAKE